MQSFMTPHPHKASLSAALWVGLIAILINTGILHLADFIPLQTAHGGLLKLLKLGLGSGLAQIGIPGAWHTLGLPAPGSEVFKTGFHIVVGLGMAVVYAFVVEPRFEGSAWVKGLLFALVLWLMNAFVILPLIGEGIAGSLHLSTAGMLYYAFAHTVFFVVLALLYSYANA